jgi:hypothetical protein
MAEGSQAPAFSKMETSPEVILTKPSKWQFIVTAAVIMICVYIYIYLKKCM